MIELRDSSLDEVFLNKAVNERRVYLNCEIDRMSITKTKFMIDKIIKIDRMSGKTPEECEPITLVINSYGGEVPHLNLHVGQYDGDIPAYIDMNSAAITNTQILVAGTTGSGKTNLLAVLMNEIRD